MMKFVVFAVALCTLVGCSGSAERQAEVKPEVVVIFKNAPFDKWLYFTTDTINGPKMGSSSLGATYIDSTYKRINFIPNPNSIDTLIIPTFDGLAEMSYTYKVAEVIDFLFVAGDTVVFDFGEDKFPIAHCTNNPARNNVYNAKSKGRMDNGFSPSSILSSLFNQRHFKYPTDTLAKAYNAQQREYRQMLDTAKVVGSDYIERARFINTLADMGIKRNIDNLNEVDPIFVEADPLSMLYSMMDDKLAYSMAYQSKVLGRLTTLITGRYASQTTYVNYGGGGGGSFSDTRVTFDTIANSPRITPVSKRIMLADILANFEFTSVKSEIEYKRKYFDVTRDTIFVRNVAELENSLNTSDDLYLVGVDGSKIGFSKLLASLAGKVVYVDLWGSGCPPCLRVMPAAAELRAKFKGRDVAFVYISCDTDNRAWMDAIKKYNVQGINYRMTNLRVSDVAKELKIFEFPRYLMYNKAGKLVDNRASGPDKEQVRGAINRQLL